MAIHCAAAERGGLIKKEIESSWVKLNKAFPTNVGKSNYLAVGCAHVFYKYSMTDCAHIFCNIGQIVTA